MSSYKAGGSANATETTQDPPPHVPNHLVWAILVTIFCCLPFGIVSIVYAAQVNGKLLAGDVAAARDSSEKAKTWAWVSFGVGIVLSVPGWIGLYAVLGFLGIVLIGLVAALGAGVAVLIIKLTSANSANGE